MPISFAHIPAGIRVPLFYAEISNRQAGFLQQDQVALLIGPMSAAGTALPNLPVQIVSFAQAAGLFGPGSPLADMVDAYRQNDSFGTLWAIPLPAPGGAAAATGSVTITGTATEAGQISLYIAGMLIRAPIALGTTAAQAATLLLAAINAQPFVTVVAAAGAAGVVNLTAKTLGILGNEIDVQLNFRGTVGGESTPAGLTVVPTVMASGAGQPVLTTAFTNMGDDEYDFIALAYSDSATLDAVSALMNDFTGRWAWDRQIYGHVFTARKDKTTMGADLVTFGVSRNDPHTTVLGFGNSPTPSWVRAAALSAQAAASLRNDPARPLQTLPLLGVLPPPRSQRFTTSMRNTLLYSGIAVEDQYQGTVRIQRSITTYQRNEWGQVDPSYLDITTMFTLAYVIRYLRERVTQKFPRFKLADDGTPYGAGQAVVTPSVIRGEMVAAYSELQSLALVENMEAFKQFLIVERNQIDPNRVDVLFPPDLVNQLRIFAAMIEFRLQYGTAATVPLAA